ncbi:CHAD domain-containing protein [Nocardioides sp. KR10-350]|uniref:CHAD domain-containing protein n=1 Tax=Nocardioides cheoyonin TaxID=3156615 RepID=UPI0032B4A488
MATRTARVRAYLADHVAAARRAEAALADPGPDTVHDARVALRRVRSTLQTFPALVPEERREQVIEALRDWSGVLGAARDHEVLLETLGEVCDDELLAALRPSLDHQAGEAWAALETELYSPAHRDLMEELESLALAEPDGGVHPRRRVRRAIDRAEKRLRRAGDDPVALHDARKAAKRARYALEAVGEDSSEPEAVQDALGAHHDCIVAIEFLEWSGVPDQRTAAARKELARRADRALAGVARR